MQADAAACWSIRGKIAVSRDGGFMTIGDPE
jgi:hypothetical protein